MQRAARLQRHRDNLLFTPGWRNYDLNYQSFTDLAVRQQELLSVVRAVDVAQVSAGRKHPAASGLPSHLYRVTCWPVAVCAELAVTHLKRWNYVKIMRCTGCSCSCHYSDRSVIFQPQTETNYLQLLTEAEQKHSELRLLTNNHQLS